MKIQITYKHLMLKRGDACEATVPSILTIRYLPSAYSAYLKYVLDQLFNYRFNYNSYKVPSRYVVVRFKYLKNQTSKIRPRSQVTLSFNFYCRNRTGIDESLDKAIDWIDMYSLIISIP